jgi:Na+/melibiose symporter-like transporter
MSSEKFIKNKTVLITLVSACLIVIISLGIRQTFGMFYFDFSTDLGITLSQFGFALGLQMFLWGAFAPWFGVITDKYGGHIAVFIGFIFYLLGVLMLVSEYNTGPLFCNWYWCFNRGCSWRNSNQYSCFSSRKTFSSIKQNCSYRYSYRRRFIWLFRITCIH